MTVVANATPIIKNICKKTVSTTKTITDIQIWIFSNAGMLCIGTVKLFIGNAFEMAILLNIQGTKDISAAQNRQTNTFRTMIFLRPTAVVPSKNHEFLLYSTEILL